MTTAKEVALQVVLKLESLGVFISFSNLFATERLATITLTSNERHVLPKLCAERDYYFHDEIKDGRIMVAFRAV